MKANSVSKRHHDDVKTPLAEPFIQRVGITFLRARSRKRPNRWQTDVLQIWIESKQTVRCLSIGNSIHIQHRNYVSSLAKQRRQIDPCDGWRGQIVGMSNQTNAAADARGLMGIGRLVCLRRHA